MIWVRWSFPRQRWEVWIDVMRVASFDREDQALRHKAALEADREAVAS